MKMNRIILGLAFVGILSAGTASAQQRKQIRVVGSSTVYPFSSYVAEEFGETTEESEDESEEEAEETN